MLSPEVVNFPPPRTVSATKNYESFDAAVYAVYRNSFYKSLIITCPDEEEAPSNIQEICQLNTDYFKLSNCSLTEFVEPTFIDKFMKRGKLFCLTANRDCVVENCAAISDGVLTIHVSEPVYQTLGFEGTKRPHDFYEVRIHLKSLTSHENVKQRLSKLELFDFYIIWEHNHGDFFDQYMIAKYFQDRKITVTTEYLKMKHMIPDISQVPSINDVEIEDMVEWVGMLAHLADLKQSDKSISSYSEPVSTASIETTTISVFIVEGFITPSLISDLCLMLSEFTRAKCADNYWTSISVQSQEDSLWQWSPSRPKMFQAHSSSYSVFFGRRRVATHMIGHMKYS